MFVQSKSWLSARWYAYFWNNILKKNIFSEGYAVLRQRFGNDSFWLHGPYHYIMKAIFHGDGVYRAFSLYPQTIGNGKLYVSELLFNLNMFVCLE